jgi:hypothetical protein
LYRQVVIDGFVCRSCGQRHEGLPFAYGSAAPAYWHEDLAGDERSVLEDEICVIQAQHYFVHARLVIPVQDAEKDFEWGVWVSLSRDNFRRMADLWSTPGRERDRRSRSSAALRGTPGSSCTGCWCRPGSGGLRLACGHPV